MGAMKDLIFNVVEYYEQQDLAPDEIAAILYMREEEIREILLEYSEEYADFLKRSALTGQRDTTPTDGWIEP